MVGKQIMNNIKNIKFLYLMAIISISLPLFSGNVNQGMSNDSENQPVQKQQNTEKPKSKFKCRYKPKTEEEIARQEKIVTITKLKLPLSALCINHLIDHNLINESVEKLINAHNLLPLLRTLQGIKKLGYRNKKLARQLIRLTLDSDYNPESSISRKHLIECSFLGDENAVSLLLSRDILKKQTNIEMEEQTGIPERISCEFNWDVYITLRKALINATKNNHLGVVQKLLDAEFDAIEDRNPVNDGMGYAWTKEMVSLYLAKNANLNEADPGQENCLTNAIIDGNIELIDFLVENGALVDRSCDEQSHITYVLEKMGNEEPAVKEIGKQILTKFACHSPVYILMLIIENDHISAKILIEAISLVLQTQAININQQDEFQETALMHAVKRRLYDIVKLLLNYGADSSLTNNENQTALDIARDQFNSDHPYYAERRETGQKIVQLLEEAKEISQWIK